MDTDSMICVAMCRSRREADECSLVLTARGIRHAVEESADSVLLLVSEPDADRARAELAAYREENRAWPPRADAEALIDPHGALAAAAYALVIGAAWLLQTSRAFGLDWWERGMSVAAAVRAGEWWRPITALTLHADAVHLAGNTLFGSIFIAAASQTLGPGVTLLAVLASGATGNVLNALLQAPEHASVGASTATFGAVGLLAAVLVRRRATGGGKWLRRFTPLFVAVALFGYLGTSGERTDVAAHALGLASGLILGIACAAIERSWLRSRSLQTACGLVALVALVVAWAFALETR